MMVGGMGGMRHWGRMGLDSETEEGRLYDHQVVARLMGYLRPHWRRLAITLVTMLAYTGTVMATPLLVGGDNRRLHRERWAIRA